MNANARKWFYILAGVIAAVMPVLVQAGFLDASQASLGGLMGGVGALTAAGAVHRQQAQGIHDPPLSPIDQIAAALPQVLTEAAQAQANVDKLRQVTGDFLTATTGGIPIVGDAVAQANSLAQQALDQLIPK